MSVRRPNEIPSDGFGQRLGGSMVVEQDTRLRILAAAKGVLLDVGYAKLSNEGHRGSSGGTAEPDSLPLRVEAEPDARRARHGEPDAAGPAGGDV